MEILKKHLNKIISAIVIIFIITFVFNYMKGDDDNLSLKENVVSQNVDNDAREIIRTLNELEKIKIDKDFFDNNLFEGNTNLISFRDLKDFSEEEIKEQPVGKRNPFIDSNPGDYIPTQQIENIVATETQAVEGTENEE